MNNKDSTALLEVYEWKEKAYKEVKDLEIKDALKNRIKKSIETATKLSFKTLILANK